MNLVSIFFFVIGVLTIGGYGFVYVVTKKANPPGYELEMVRYFMPWVIIMTAICMLIAVICWIKERSKNK